MKVLYIFPHQLFKNIQLAKECSRIYLIEDALFFYDKEFPVKFHKQKLVLHRSSMKNYAHFLHNSKLDVEYIDYKANNLEESFAQLPPNTEVNFYDPVDYILTKRIKKFAKKYDLKLTAHESPNFITSNQEIKTFFKEKKRFHQTDFYRWQRKRLNILMDDKMKPLGGKLTYDQENRKKLPKDIELPSNSSFKFTKITNEAIQYVQSHFSDHPGEVSQFNYPVTHAQAEQLLQDFITTKFDNFGIYEDAFTQQDNPFLFHSALSSSLNIGLLEPMQIVKQALQAKAPLNSLEGFIRQIIGWREFMRAIYILKGSTQRTSNFLNNQKKLPAGFWTAQTGILPLDNIISKLNKYAYSHHIERLMVLGNFMNLSEIHPDEVYKWFMTFYIDAYDWVMVPNVYGMTLFADGGLITTKPYVSSSNYILKMSDYKKGDWATLWDSLYWNFVQKNQTVLSKNIRFGLILKQLEKMDDSKVARIKTQSVEYLNTLDNR
jgi:deoxyribodipyrimidine photolyase-related protein